MLLDIKFETGALKDPKMTLKSTSFLIFRSF